MRKTRSGLKTSELKCGVSAGSRAQGGFGFNPEKPAESRLPAK